MRRKISIAAVTVAVTVCSYLTASEKQEVTFTYLPAQEGDHLVVENGETLHQTTFKNHLGGHILARIWGGEGVIVRGVTAESPAFLEQEVQARFTVTGKAGLVFHGRAPRGPDTFLLEVNHQGNGRYGLTVAFNTTQAHVGVTESQGLFTLTDERGDLAAVKAAMRESPFALSAAVRFASAFRAARDEGRLQNASALSTVITLALSPIINPPEERRIGLGSITVVCPPTRTENCNGTVQCEGKDAVNVSQSPGSTATYTCEGEITFTVTK